jgi:hypothetical protein
MNEPIKYENLGAEILALLRSKADAKWEYYNPHFLVAIAETIQDYYQLEDEVVWDWIQDMAGA